MITIDGLTFELTDFERSATAKRNGIDNTLKGNDVDDYTTLMDIIVKIQKKYIRPIYVSSGFRSKALNKAVGGVYNSQHRSLGADAAADITAGNTNDNRMLYATIRRMVLLNEIVLDQIIDEKGFSWIHISIKRIGVNRKQFLKL